MTPTVDNILAVFRSASAYAFLSGMTWYDEAHEFAKSLDGNRFMRAAGVIAALSPMNQWDNNKTKAAQVYSQRGVINWDGNRNGIGLASNVRKAIAIYNGEDALDVLTAPKTRSFFLTIADPYGDHAPVIDRHAFDIAVGARTSDKARSILSRKGEYDRFAACYQQAANVAGIAPSQIQAITWVAWKERFGML